MSDRKWKRDVWSVLLADGTELLDITINQSDYNKWPEVAARRGWTGDEFNGHRNQFAMWTALQRRGDIDPTFTLDKFLEQIAAAHREDTETVDPTPPAP